MVRYVFNAVVEMVSKEQRNVKYLKLICETD